MSVFGLSGKTTTIPMVVKTIQGHVMPSAGGSTPPALPAVGQQWPLPIR